jgi:peptide/nickel transport system ATP-binding protein
MKPIVPTAPALLRVQGLTLELAHSGKRVVDRVSFELQPGELVGIVGESGSGKTLAARALMGLEPPAIRRAGGEIEFEGRSVPAMSAKELRDLRGARVGMVFQEPMTSLNPAMRIGRQLEEGLIRHRGFTPAERRRLIVEMLLRVGIQDAEGALRAYPHEFSGGMRQRIMLASVMLLKPALLLADEPTTALDAVVQREVIELMVALARDHGTAVLMISHDLSMVARYTHRMIVMCQGEIVEQGSTEQLLRQPRHPYTRKLLAAMPRRSPARAVPSAEPIVEVRGLVVDYGARGGLFRKGAGKRALHGIDLTIQPREVVAVVGGSGSGKTTLGRVIAGLLQPSGGEIRFAGKRLAETGGALWRDYRLNCQMVFQDPYSSLDPRMAVGALIKEALRQVPGLTEAQRQHRVLASLDEVGLDSGHAARFPHELSGGQRQRVAIARAVVRRPRFVIADEPVSALDMTVRAQILELFATLQEKHGFACMFVSHDLAVVEQVADRVVVMQEGRIVEQGSRDAVFDQPRHEYTRRLLGAIPALEAGADGGVRLKWRTEDPGRGPAQAAAPTPAPQADPLCAPRIASA